MFFLFIPLAFSAVRYPVLSVTPLGHASLPTPRFPTRTRISPIPLLPPPPPLVFSPPPHFCQENPFAPGSPRTFSSDPPMKTLGRGCAAGALPEGGLCRPRALQLGEAPEAERSLGCGLRLGQIHLSVLGFGAMAPSGAPPGLFGPSRRRRKTKHRARLQPLGAGLRLGRVLLGGEAFGVRARAAQLVRFSGGPWLAGSQDLWQGPLFRAAPSRNGRKPYQSRGQHWRG